MKEQIKNLLGWLAAGLIFLAAIFLAVEIKNRAASQVDLSKTRTVTMTAEGKVTAKPDIALVSFSVVTQGKDADKVQADNDNKMKNVIDFLKSQSVADDDIKTSGYNLYPQYDYGVPSPGIEVKPPGIIGYSLTQTVAAKVRDLGKVSGIVGGLTSKGVNQIDTVSYTIDDPDQLKAEARNQAVEKAKNKAKELADKLGVKLGRVINFSEGEIYLPQPYYMDRAVSAPGFGGGGASPVEPGSQDVTVNVTLTFELK